jgi:hypothetical protein
MTLATTTADLRDAPLLVQPNGTVDSVARLWAGQLDETRLCFTAYRFALLMSLSIWFLAIRAPLWLDETSSYWSISGGFGQIWSRSIELNSFPAYYYILWFTNAVFGSKEIVLRIPSVLAMTAATYVFYRCARELFARETSLAAAAIFILDGRVAFAAIDVRPYAFAMLATNLSIFIFIRWRKTKATLLAALLGIACAGVFYFHYLFGLIVAALAICYLLDRSRSLRADWRQLTIAVSCFALFMLPLLPRLFYLQKTKEAHIFSAGAEYTDFLQALFWGIIPFVFVGTALAAAYMRRLVKPCAEDLRQLRMCATLALVPLGFLYVVTVATPLHIFVERYQGVAVPGIALCWAWVFSRIDSRRLRLLCCLAFVTWTIGQTYASPEARLHGCTWKFALAFADARAAQADLPLLICSDLPEANFQNMPTGPASESVLFAPLSYYKVRADVIPLPRALDEQTQMIGGRFSLFATQEHKPFLALTYRPSYPTWLWLASQTSRTHEFRVLGDFDGIKVVEFDPRDSSHK